MGQFSHLCCAQRISCQRRRMFTFIIFGCWLPHEKFSNCPKNVLPDSGCSPNPAAHPGTQLVRLWQKLLHLYIINISLLCTTIRKTFTVHPRLIASNHARSFKVIWLTSNSRPTTLRWHIARVNTNWHTNNNQR